MLDVVLIFFATLLAVWWWMSSRRFQKLPPSPGIALPFIGHLYLLSKNPMEDMKKWRKKLGDVFTVQFGSQTVILVNGQEAIHEVCVKQHHNFLERPRNFSQEELFQYRGIISLGSEAWKEHRAFLQSTLRSLGMGKNVMAERIMTEVEYLLASIGETKGEPTNIKTLVTVCVCNVICSLSFGKRFDHKDDNFLKGLRIMDRLFELLGTSSVLNFFPVLKHLPGDYFHYKELSEYCSKMRNKIKVWVGKDKRQINCSDDSFEDVAQAFFIEMEKRKEKGIPLSTIDDSNLISTLFALFNAGTETTSTTIMFALLYMVYYPDIQERLYNEIKDNVGTSRLPTLADKTKLKYLNAFISETQRYTSVVPMTIDRLSTQEVKIKDYVIPKGSSVIAVLDSLLLDEEIWDDPQTFKPERFLEGYRKEFLPFSTGRRNCVGEPLAVMDLYLFLSAMIQRFQFLPEHPDQKPSLIPDQGFTRAPKPFKVRALPR